MTKIFVKNIFKNHSKSAEILQIQEYLGIEDFFYSAKVKQTEMCEKLEIMD